MARTGGSKAVVNFSKGLISDASPLAYPANSCTTLQNFHLHADGTLEKRQGLAIKYTNTYVGDAFTGSTYNRIQDRVDLFVWKNPGNVSNYHFLVERIGYYIHISQMDSTNQELVAYNYGVGGKVYTTIDLREFVSCKLDSYYITGSGSLDDCRVKPIDITQGRGRLLICGEMIEPFYIKYDSTLQTFSTARIHIKVRDFNLITDTSLINKLDGTTDPSPYFDVSNRPSDISWPDTYPSHAYNIYNSGWTSTGVLAFAAGNVPSRADVPWRSSATIVDSEGTQAQMAGVSRRGATQAPIGHFTSQHDAFIDCSTYYPYIANNQHPTATYVYSSTLGYLDVTLTSATNGFTVGDIVSFIGATYTTTEGATLSWDNIYRVVHVWTPDNFALTGINYNLLAAGSLVGAATLTLQTTDGFPSTGAGCVWTGGIPDTFTWTGKTSTTLTGCTGLGAIHNLNDQVILSNLAPPTGFTFSAIASGGRIYRGGYLKGLATERTNQRPKSIAFYAGRTWYGGIDTPYIGGNIFYSKIISVDKDFEICYQEGDPTSEYNNEIVATDGGYLKIAEAGKVIKLVPFGNALLAFSKTGIWKISGIDSIFDPTNFTVSRVFDGEIWSKDAITITENGVAFLANGDLYMVTEHPQTGYLTVVNISITRISEYIHSIPVNNRDYIVSVYNRSHKELFILFNSIDYGSSPYYYENNTLLVYNTQLDAFYEHTLPTPTVDGIIYCIKSVYPIILANNDACQQILLCVQNADTPHASNTIHYIVDMSSDTFSEWGQNRYTAVCETSYEVGGDTTQGQGDIARGKQSPYITCHFGQTETQFVNDGAGNPVYDIPSSCYLQAKWDWTNNRVAGKYGPMQQVYRMSKEPIYSGGGLPEAITTGNQVVVTKNKLRGSGRALQLRFESPRTKTCHLYGYQLDLTGKGAT